MRIPLSPCSWAQMTSRTAASTSYSTGTMATPMRRPGAMRQNSAIQRLWARAPAHWSSGFTPHGFSPRPAPKGGALRSVMPSGKSTSAATPSPSMTSMRMSESQAAASLPAFPARHFSLKSLIKKSFSRAARSAISAAITASKASRNSGSR